MAVSTRHACDGLYGHSLASRNGTRVSAHRCQPPSGFATCPHTACCPIICMIFRRACAGEKSPLTYQFLTFGISPRNMTYQPGIWHISVVWHISQDFDISVRILYRLPLQYKPFCTVLHCSTKPGVFASGTWESHSVPSFTPPPTKLLPFSQTTTRAVTPVAVGRRPLYARQD